MQGNLLVEFEKLLDVETQRIISVLADRYYKGETIKGTFEEEIRKLVKNEYKYYACEIELRSYRFIPQGLVPGNGDGIIFMTKEEFDEDHLLHYINYCKKSNSKNHITASKKLAKIIVDTYEKDPLTDKQFQEIVANNMNKLLPEHNDSVDAKAIILLLQQEIVDLGYIITSLLPLRLQKI